MAEHLKDGIQFSTPVAPSTAMVTIIKNIHGQCKHAVEQPKTDSATSKPGKVLQQFLSDDASHQMAKHDIFKRFMLSDISLEAVCSQPPADQEAKDA